MTGIDFGLAAAVAALPLFIVLIAVSALAWVGRPWRLVSPRRPGPVAP